MKIEKLKEIFDGSNHLESKTEMELGILSSILEEDEIPVKEMDVKTLNENLLTVGEDNVPEQITIKGKLLITDKKILFFTTSEIGVVMGLPYEIMDDFVTGYNEEDKSEGIIVIYANGVYYSFLGVSRFGLKHWEEYVNKKIDESFD